MLLRSVGQEDKVVEETIIEQLDEPGCLNKVMDANLNHESQKESVVKNHSLSVLVEKVDNKFDDVAQEENQTYSMEKSLSFLPNVEAVKNTSEMLKSEDLDSKITSIMNSSVENDTIIGKTEQQITSGPSLVSAGNLPETAGESDIEKGVHAGGSVEVDCKMTSSESAAVHVDQDDSFNKKEDASFPVENTERHIEVRSLDSQTDVEPSSYVEGSKENTIIAHTSASVQVEQVTVMVSDDKETDDQPRSPIFGVSLVDSDNKETVKNDEILQDESVVASGSKNPSSLVGKEASPDHVVNVVRGTDVHCEKLVESSNTSQLEQEPETDSGSQETIKTLETSAFEFSEIKGNTSQTGGLHDPKESMVEVNKLSEHQPSVDVTRPSDFKAKDKQEAAKDVRHESATQEGKNFTFEVNRSAGFGQDDKDFQSYPTFQVSNLPKIVDSSSSQLDARKLDEVSHSSQNPSGLITQTGVKGKSERKPRRKSVPKENTRKRLSITPPATVGVLSSPKLPDLNNSTSILQQPFSDNQQVQLRAQILVYGSLMSGSPPEEPHMLAAFGQSDGGRIWEGVWHACVERHQVQKTQAKSNKPLQSISDLRDAGSLADQGAKHASVHTKVTSSSIGVTSNKATLPIFSPRIPHSAPLWNISTPSDYRQSLSLLNPYQTPPVQQSFSAHNNPSWLSQGPFGGQWLPSINSTPTFPTLPLTEAVKLTPVKESVVSVLKHTSIPTVLNYAPTIFPEAPTGEPKSRKRKKGIPAVSIPFSTSDAASAPALITSKNIPANFLSDVSPINDPNKEKVVISEGTLTKVEESKLQSKDATKHAAAAVNDCHSVWNQLERQYNLGLSLDNEAKLVSSAVSVAAAASVAKVAAAAAKLASDYAEQARLMVDGFLSNKSQNIDPSSINTFVNKFDKATPDSFLVGASPSSKHAESLNAIVKAAELAAEAVSQAGKIVAMSEPMHLRDLIKAGPEGYWKTPGLASKQQLIVAENLNGNENKIVASAPKVSDKEILTTRSSLSRNENSGYVGVEGISLPFTGHEKSKRKPWVRKGANLAKTIGVVPELEIGSIDTSVGLADSKAPTGLKDNNIEEGCLVEVYKDDDAYNGAWFGAIVLSLKDGKALVCYTEIQSDEGKLKEWVPLEIEGTEVPKIRVPHPVTTMRIEGTRKRSRTASTDYVWSSGDQVDVWIQDRWCEGVVMEINKMDVSSITVKFPAQGVTSVVRSWFVRPTLIWKDGKWIESHRSEKQLSSQGDMPQEKRLKLGSPIVESKPNDMLSEKIDRVDPKKQEEQKTLSLSTMESVFNIGTNKDNKKVTAQRTIRSGSQKEGPRVIFGVPKPGKKQKFMEIGSNLPNKNKTSHDSVKFTKYLIPQAPGSRGWRNNFKSAPKEKQAPETKSRTMSRKPPVPSRRPFASSKSTIAHPNIDGENESGHQNRMEIGSSTDIEDEPRHEDLISSLARSQPPKGLSTSRTRSQRLKKRKFAPTVGKSANVEKSLPELVETRKSSRRIQPTSRLLEGLQSSMTILKTPAASHSSQRSRSKVTPTGNTNNA